VRAGVGVFIELYIFEALAGMGGVAAAVVVVEMIRLRFWSGLFAGMENGVWDPAISNYSWRKNSGESKNCDLRSGGSLSLAWLIMG